MSRVTHTVQFAVMDLRQACETVLTFCSATSLYLEQSLEQARSWRAQGRREDASDWGWVPEDAEIEGGEEQRIAQDEEWPLIEVYELLGVFSLVFLASHLDKFLEEVITICGWSVAASTNSVEVAPKSFLRKLKCIQENTHLNLLESPVDSMRVQEVFLARNDFLHNRRYVGKEYQKQVTSPRFVRPEDGAITASASKQIPEIVRDLRLFADFIVEKCIPFSPSV